MFWGLCCLKRKKDEAHSVRKWCRVRWAKSKKYNYFYLIMHSWKLHTYSTNNRYPENIVGICMNLTTQSGKGNHFYPMMLSALQFKKMRGLQCFSTFTDLSICLCLIRFFIACLYIYTHFDFILYFTKLFTLSMYILSCTITPISEGVSKCIAPLGKCMIIIIIPLLFIINISNV